MEKIYKSKISTPSRASEHQPFFGSNTQATEPFFAKSNTPVQRKPDKEDDKNTIKVKVDSNSENFKNIYRISLFYGISQDSIINLNKEKNPDFDYTILKNGEEIFVPLKSTQPTDKKSTAIEKENKQPVNRNNQIEKIKKSDNLNYNDLSKIIIENNRQYAVAISTQVVPMRPLPNFPVVNDNSMDSLLKKTTLTPLEIKKVILYANNLTDTSKRKEIFLLLQSKVEYINQRKSMSEEVEEEYSDAEKKAAEKGERVYAETSDGGMCNLSSLAMALQNLGIANPNPNLLYQDALEEVRVKLKLEKLSGVGKRIDWSTWVAIAKHLGAKGSASIALGEKKSKKWYLDNFLPDLQSGAGIMLSFEGHIVRLENVTESGFIIDDPYGKMNPVKREEKNGGGWDATNSKRDDKNNKIVGKDNVWTWEQIGKIALKGYTVVKY